MTQLFGLPIAAASRWIFNCYVIEDGGAGRPVVVDAGLPCTATDAVALLRARGVADTVALVSTHGHSDHVSGIPEVLRAFKAEVLLPARCRAYLAGESARSPGFREVAKIAPILTEQGFDKQAAREFVGEGSHIGYGRTPSMSVPFDVDGYLSDGDVVPNAPEWEVIHAPGHSDDSTCLYHRDTATLLSGDAIITQGGEAWFNPEVVDPIVARETEERLRELDVRHLLPGHGQPIAGKQLLRNARSFKSRPTGSGILARLARGLGRW